MDTGRGGYIALHERCTKDIQLSSQLCLPAREIGGVPGRTRTDLIMDQYPDVSIKNPERERENGVVQRVPFK